MTAAVLANNLWVLLCGLFVFMMTIAVGLLEGGELGERVVGSLVKTILITGLAVLVMAVVGFNTAFAPTPRRHHRQPVLLPLPPPGRLLPGCHSQLVVADRSLP